MALNGTVLAAGIKAKVATKNLSFVANIGNDMDWFFEAVAEAVVEHVQASAVVTVTTASACSAGGAVASGTGTVS